MTLALPVPSIYPQLQLSDEEIIKKFIIKRKNRNTGYNLVNILFIRGIPRSVALKAIVKAYLKSDNQPWHDKIIYKQYERRLRDTVSDLARNGLIIQTKETNGTITISPSNSPVILMISNRLTKSPTKQKPRRKQVTTPNFRKQRWLNICSKTMTLSANKDTSFEMDFNEYKNDKFNSIHLFKKRKSTSTEPEIISIPAYMDNRFIDPQVQKKDIAKYNAAWQLASTRHERAVFFTVTIDPDDFTNLVDANTALPDRLEKLYRKLYNLPKTRNKTIERLTVHEFHQNGLRHAHILLFGVGYLTWIPALKQICKACGLRTSFDICMIKKDPITNTWNCSEKNRRRLKFTSTNPNYLMEYLCKTVSNRINQKWHWLFQTPFFTTSKSLRAAKPPANATPQTETYEYAVCCPKGNADDLKKELLDEINGSLTPMHVQTILDGAVFNTMNPVEATASMKLS